MADNEDKDAGDDGNLRIEIATLHAYPVNTYTHHMWGHPVAVIKRGAG